MTANVPVASTAPVNDMSLCVIPCWMRSPTTTSRIRSKGSSERSSRRPMSRVTRKTKRKAKNALTTMSMSSGPDHHVTLRCREQLGVVVEPDVLTLPTQVVRVDLELQVDGDRIARRHVAEVERELPVAARFAYRGRFDRVDVHRLQPARCEHERGLRNLLVRGDAKAALEVEPTSNIDRSGDLEPSGGRLNLGTRRALSERVRDPEQ